MLICGYRTTGKNAFYDSLVGKNIYKWYVYALDDAKFVFTPKKSASLADTLKKAVWKEINYDPELPENNEEKDKDTKLITHPKSNETKLLRQWYIDTAKICLSKDVNCFVRQVLFDEYTMITDFRYPHELKYLKESSKFNIETIRVFDKNIEVPNCQSERSLDDLQTTYLALKDREHFNDALKLFPQYTGYKFICTIN